MVMAKTTCRMAGSREARASAVGADAERVVANKGVFVSLNNTQVASLASPSIRPTSVA